MGIYKDLGVKTYINPGATYTALGGSIMPPEVLEAMRDASKHFVMIPELQRKAGDQIAEWTHNEAAFVSNGAASGMVLAAAAIIAGDNDTNRWNLPDSTGLKNEVLVADAFLPGYSHAIKVGGGVIKTYGKRGQKITAADLEAAITDKSAAVFYFHDIDLINAGLMPEYDELIAVAKKHNLRFVVDAAAQIPPVENLWKFTQAGADIAIFSGGKGLRGPQSSGLMVGKRDIIDIVATYACPNTGVGRPMKVGKEEIIGLMKAVELAVKTDEKEVMAGYEKQVDYAMAELGRDANLKLVRVPTTDVGKPFSHLNISILPGAYAIDTKGLSDALMGRDPAVYAPGKEAISLNPQTLQAGEMEQIVAIIREILDANKL